MQQWNNLLLWLVIIWTDIIEQVVPATTIWGSVKIYSNTIFDQQKFKYKNGSLFICDDYAAESIAFDLTVDVDKTTNK